MQELYHPRVLELAAEIRHLGRLSEPHGAARRVSRVCGSEVEVSLRLDALGRIAAFAIEPKACALGQASAGVLAGAALGAAAQEIRDARDGLFAMLKAGGPPPVGRFWELRHLEGVRDYPARHASVLLAFDAAVAALDQALDPAPRAAHSPAGTASS